MLSGTPLGAEGRDSYFSNNLSVESQARWTILFVELPYRLSSALPTDTKL